MQSQRNPPSQILGCPTHKLRWTANQARYRQDPMKSMWACWNSSIQDLLTIQATSRTHHDRQNDLSLDLVCHAYVTVVPRRPTPAPSSDVDAYAIYRFTGPLEEPTGWSRFLSELHPPSNVQNCDPCGEVKTARESSHQQI